MELYEDKNSFGQEQICIPRTEFPRVVVVGGGFAGLNLIRKLKHLPVQVVLIDKNNFHQFIPLLYQVAISGLQPENVVFPFRKLFEKNSNFVFRMAEGLRIDTAGNTLITTIGNINYDYLVLATGSKTNFFGNENFERFGTGLNSITDALHIRFGLLQNLEQAAMTCREDEKKKFSNVVIVGGGATGVEISGVLAEFKRYILPKDFPELKNIEMKVFLIEATGRLLRSMPEKLAEKALEYLKEMKVDVLFNTSVSSYDGEKAVLDNGNALPTKNFIWTAGVSGKSIEGLSDKLLSKHNCIFVDAFNRIESVQNVFVIGDTALLKTKEYPNGHPMVVQPAMQQGKLLAENLGRLIAGKPLKPFEYKDKGEMTTIGKKKAVVRIGNFKLSGFFAWFIWSFVHLISIIGVKDKLLLLINWTWSYFTYNKGDRIIIRKDVKDHKKEM